jgi:hypothetical protein
MAAPKKSSAMAKATKALSLASQMQSQREKKFVVTSFVQNTDRVGHIIALNNVSQGSTDSERVGDRIECVHLSGEFWRVIPGSASGRFSLRFLLVIDRQNLITDMSSVFLGTDSAFSPFLQYVKDQRKRFVVLYDSGPNHMDQYNKGECTRFSRKINLRTQYIGGTSTIATGSLKLLCISNQAENSNSRPILLGSVRVDYTDS